ncbi:hypothetical protein AYL99_11005 [Fonsecaea erecta]|uniref:Uncharacterized protein n=1 Tax=Fonsecaea erecta TaxID=1367422 RepID=A0A178Z493_9EURO|nr:hypothetical protein AYL99_11005 [Fonsecaea erecta]OAP54557.1 hypothetical protein AYL99_11005 [Fonsecaea erecta]
MSSDIKHPSDEESHQEEALNPASPTPSSTTKTPSVETTPPRDPFQVHPKDNPQEEFEVWHDCEPCASENVSPLLLSPIRLYRAGALQEIEATLHVERYSRSGCIHLAYFLGARRIFSIGLPLRAIISERHEDEYCACDTVGDGMTTPEAEDGEGPAGLVAGDGGRKRKRVDDDEESVSASHRETRPRLESPQHPTSLS